jgi:hypothetical protein
MDKPRSPKPGLIATRRIAGDDGATTNGGIRAARVGKRAVNELDSRFPASAAENSRVNDRCKSLE